MRSRARTVQGYLAALPDERRAVVQAVRNLVVDNLPEGYAETIDFGMISYVVPLERFPRTYNGHPLTYVAIAAQKRHYGLYLMGLDVDRGLEAGLRTSWHPPSGKKLSLGKACLRFGSLSDLDVEHVAAVVGAVSVETYLAHYKATPRV